MTALLAILLAVAGGNLAVTAAPAQPRVGRQVVVRSTGDVGQSGGHLYIYRNAGRRCGDTLAAERRIGRRLADRPVGGPFDFAVSYRPGRAEVDWVCGYLYAITCDAAGGNCAPAVGLPPDAGFDRVRIRVRPRA